MIKKNVLFVIESLGGGGAEKVLVTLINNIDKKKFNVTLCTIVDTGVHKKNLSSDIKYIPILKLKPFLGSQYLGKIFYRIMYNIIYKLLPLRLVYKFYVPKGNDVEIAFVEGFCTKLLSYSTNKIAKKLAWVHIDLVQNHWIKKIYKNKKAEYRSYKKYDRVIGVSANVIKSVKTLYDLDHVSVIHNPINSEIILKQGIKDCQISTSYRIRLVSVGRLVEQKGYDRLLRIFNRLVTEDFDIELLLLGEGEEKKKLQEYIELNKLNDRVLMPGFVENPYAEMAKCDLFVCSSRSEGYSTAVTEALILGLPIVTTACSGMDELLMDGKYGIITENNEDALYVAIKDLLSSKEKLLYYKQKAHERSKDFNLRTLMYPIETLLERNNEKENSFCHQ